MSAPRKPERTRTFTGCQTCRSRHSKCDEAQPECSTCRRLGLVCGGYAPRLFWVTDSSAVTPEQTQSHRGSGYRYPLFSDLDRRLMSAELSESLGNQSTLDLLAEIDAAGEMFEGKPQLLKDLKKGPFGVFQILESATTSTQSSPSFEETCNKTSVDHDVLVSQDSDDPVEEFQQQDWADQLNDVNFDLFEPSLDAPLCFQAQDSIDATDQLLVADMNIPDVIFSSAQYNLPGLSSQLPSEIEGDECISNGESFSPNHIADVVISNSPASGLIQGRGDGFAIPKNAASLLRYYKERIDLASSTFQARRKSPWQIIFLPCALETFAELSLWNEASHTRSAIFYTLLAHSAFEINAKSQGERFDDNWREIGVGHQEKAQFHLRNALQHEMFGPRQAKYKELLMAILAMAMTSLYHSGHTFKAFLLDAERLIRLRGLPKRKAFHVRLLHHMYTHLRVIFESISIRPGPNVATSNQLSTQADCRTFRIGEEALNIGLDSTQEKIADIGYNDIHLEIQGRWNETLYPIIYGIPESLMTLLSQSICFANERTRFDRLSRSNNSLSAAIKHHVKTLENSIWSWSLPIGPPKPIELYSQADEAIMNDPHARLMAQAIHQALIIYFYRRIYNMNAMILQDLVTKTLSYLEPCLDQVVEDGDFAASLAWPAFIAACEAMSPDLQEKSLKCLAVIENRGVLFTSRPAKDIVVAIWEKRASCGDFTISWPSLELDSTS